MFWNIQMKFNFVVSNNFCIFAENKLNIWQKI